MLLRHKQGKSFWGTTVFAIHKIYIKKSWLQSLLFKFSIVSKTFVILCLLFVLKFYREKINIKEKDIWRKILIAKILVQEFYTQNTRKKIWIILCFYSFFWVWHFVFISILLWPQWSFLVYFLSSLSSYVLRVGGNPGHGFPMKKMAAT